MSIENGQRPDERGLIVGCALYSIEGYEQVCFGHSRHPREVSDMRAPLVSE